MDSNGPYTYAQSSTWYDTIAVALQGLRLYMRPHDAIVTNYMELEWVVSKTGLQFLKDTRATRTIMLPGQR